MEKLIKKIIKMIGKMKADHVSAYAAQSAFFLMLSLIPRVLLLLAMVQFTPISKADVMLVAYKMFPSTVRASIVSVIDEVYGQSKAMIPISAVIASWSAGRVTLAVTKGLNCIYEQEETRNYFYLRIRSAIYTVLLLLAAVLSFELLGVSFFLIIFFSTMVYRFLPNNQREWKKQLPGAVLTAVGWTTSSYIFSIYIDIFKGFSNMYGSLKTIVIIMLWLYFCMYMLLLGGELNVLLERKKID